MKKIISFVVIVLLLMPSVAVSAVYFLDDYTPRESVSGLKSEDIVKAAVKTDCVEENGYYFAKQDGVTIYVKPDKYAYTVGDDVSMSGFVVSDKEMEIFGEGAITMDYIDLFVEHNEEVKRVDYAPAADWVGEIPVKTSKAEISEANSDIFRTSMGVILFDKEEKDFVSITKYPGKHTITATIYVVSEDAKLSQKARTEALSKTLSISFDIEVYEKAEDIPNTSPKVVSDPNGYVKIPVGIQATTVQYNEPLTTTEAPTEAKDSVKAGSVVENPSTGVGTIYSLLGASLLLAGGVAVARKKKKQ